MSANQTTPESYPVGFKQPPHHTRFRKGRSGNPKGRPKGTPNFATALEAALSEQVIVNEGGQRYPVTKLVATVKQLVNKATQGDPRATQQVLNVLQIIDHAPGDANPPSLNITERDQLVMQHLLARIRHTIHGAHHDVAHP